MPAPPPPPIVFLHLPKTAGQTIHAALSQAIGQSAVSPIRHPRGEEVQFPLGYQLYSGHLDWARYPATAPAPFAFTVLRDPLERLASFYLYLRARAEKLDLAEASSPENIGLRRIRALSATAYFFTGPPAWQRFIRDHYENPYCRYLATGRFRGAAPPALLRHALRGAGALGGVYRSDDLAPLGRDLARHTGVSVSFAQRLNQGGQGGLGQRWQELANLVQDPAVMARLAQMVTLDQRLMRVLWSDQAAQKPRKAGAPRDPTRRGDRPEILFQQTVAR